MKEILNEGQKTETQNTNNSRSVYEIIFKSKTEDFRIFGKHCDWDFEKKMEALKSGAPEKTLAEDKMARDIVRTLLKAERPIIIGGNDSENNRVVVLKEWNGKEVNEGMYSLMNKDGLLDFTFSGCGPNYWCFESELVVKPWAVNPAYMESHFRPNNELRVKLTEILEPFKAETE